MDKQEKIKELADKVTELGEEEKLEELISSNVYEFKVDDKDYRVRKPNFSERALIAKERNKQYIKMLNDDAYELEETLIEMYRKKGIDIPKMDNKVKVLQKTEDELMEKMAPLKNKQDIDKLKKEVEQLRIEQSQVLAKKSDLLQYSLERQLNEHINSYSVYLLLEVKDGENWTKLAENYDDFLQIDNEPLFVQGACYLTLMLWQKNV